MFVQELTDPANISCFRRCFFPEDVFSEIIFHLPRHRQKALTKNCPKTSLQGVFYTFSRRIPRRLQDVFAKRILCGVFNEKLH